MNTGEFPADDAIYRSHTAVFYDDCAEGVLDDVDFYVGEARLSGSPVLELGCGTGRILIPMAEAGVRMVGIDRSPDMLAIAEKKVGSLRPDVRSRIELAEGDMRSFSRPERFKLIAIPCRAFLHLLTVEDQRRALTCIREHLAEDGRLVFNIFDPSVSIIAAYLGSRADTLSKLTEFVQPESGRRVIVWCCRHYDLENQVLHEQRIFEELDEHDVAMSRRHAGFTLRMCNRYEIQHLLELCGFTIEALYGDFARGPFRAGGEQIWIARRAS